MAVKRCAFVYWPGMKKEFDKTQTELREGEVEETRIRHSKVISLPEFINEAMTFVNSLGSKLISINEYTYPKSKWVGDDKVLCITVYYRG